MLKIMTIQILQKQKKTQNIIQLPDQTDVESPEGHTHLPSQEVQGSLLAAFFDVYVGRVFVLFSNTNA